MPLDGSIITGPDYAFVDDVTYDYSFDTETKLGLATHTFLTTSPSVNGIQMPESMNGQVYEIFARSATTGLFFSGGDDAYFGVINTAAAMGDWYYISRDVGVLGMGFRSGPLLSTGAADGNFRLRWRTFGSTHGTVDASYTNIGILVGNPVPLAAARLINGSASIGGSSGTYTNLTGTEVFDDGDCMDHTTGIFTAPAGAGAAVINCNMYGSTFDSGDGYVRLYKNNVLIATWMHAASGRCPGPGTFGLEACSPGDEFQVRLLDYKSGTDTFQWEVSAEFY